MEDLYLLKDMAKVAPEHQQWKLAEYPIERLRQPIPQQRHQCRPCAQHSESLSSLRNNEGAPRVSLRVELNTRYVYFGGKRIARRDSSGNVVYYVADHLGTSRVVTNSAGAILDQSDFYPFGAERILNSSSGNTYKFEGKERDAETNNDDFGVRYYSSQFGRWTSPDWFAIPAPVPVAALETQVNPFTFLCFVMALAANVHQG